MRFNRTRFLIPLVLCLLLPISAFAGSFLDAQEAYDRGDYATAFTLMKPLAEQGDTKAQAMLGVMYANGLGVPANFTEAEKWYRKAAEQGDANAQNALGIGYTRGIETFPQDYVEAVKWFRRAAEQGDATGEYNLSLMYGKGKGVPRDIKEAMKWTRKAAEHGQAAAQYLLGRMYAYGQTVPQDYVQAHMWFNLSSMHSGGEKREMAIKGREFVASKMTPAQIAEAERLAREWMPKKEGKNEGE